MATLNKLTAKQADTHEDGRYSDGGGLYLRVDDGGRRRRWVYRYTKDGKTHEKGLGARDAVTLKEAREKRNAIVKQVAAGQDPRADRQKAQEHARTFGDVAKLVIAKNSPSWSASSLRAWENSLHKDAKPLADIPVADITLADVKRVVLPIEERDDHIAARRTLSRIEKVLAAAIAHDWRERANVASWSVFEILAKRPKADRRHPMLPWREAPAAFARMMAADNIQAKCLAFVTLTAVRLSEALGAQWSEINFDAATWTIPAERMKVKGNDPHIVPLSRQALELLSELRVHATSAYVFPGQDMRRPVSRMAVWEQCRKLTDDRASPHGWRATFRSWCADNGVEREVAESALAHSLGGVEAAYNRAAMVERRRKVMASWAAFLAGESSAAVVPFRR
jgi:integrase